MGFTTMSSSALLDIDRDDSSTRDADSMITGGSTRMHRATAEHEPQAGDGSGYMVAVE